MQGARERSDRTDPAGRLSGGAGLKLLFLMGYGRSGSTFFDILLNNAAEVTGLGALGHYWTWLAEGRACACGEPLEGCPQWAGIVDGHLERLRHRDLGRWNEVQEAVERRSRLPRLLGGRLAEELLERYRRATGALLAEVRHGIRTGAVVDSSGSGARSTGRAYALERHTEADVRVIHLVRDGRAVAWSSLKGAGSPERPEVRLPRPLKAIRAGAAWAVANLACEWIAAKLGPGRVLRVRYEDLATDPAGQLRRVEDFAGLRLEDLIRKVKTDAPLEVGHHVAGNRLRFREEIRIRPDFSWREAMPAPYRWTLTAGLWPLLLRYGYLGSGAPGYEARPAPPRDAVPRG